MSYTKGVFELGTVLLVNKNWKRLHGMQNYW